MFQPKCREAITEEAKEVRLEGEVDIDGRWFGGYLKPENVKINRVDRRLGRDQRHPLGADRQPRRAHCRRHHHTNAMESFFSRLRRFEATHGQISGTSLHRYVNDAAWRENNRMVDDQRRTTMVMRAAVTAPRSRSFSGYWQRGSANQRDDIFGDVFSAFA